jgi:membrane protease YdiL (CAAX protease family)
MFKNLIERTAYKDWKAALFLLALIGCVHFIAAFLKSYPLNLFGMMLYALATLIFVRKRAWKEIRIKKPISSMYILWGILLTALFVLVSYAIHYYTVDFSSSNFMALVAKQQIGFGMITKYNAWQYFPIAAIGFCTISPLTEEPFFRGLLTKSFEDKFSALSANLLQAFLFSFIHLAYYWLIEFNLGIIIPTFLGMPIGILFGWIVQKTDSLISSIILHVVHNFILIFLVYALIIPTIG